MILSQFFWIKHRGKWVVAERLFRDRWFICGVDHVITKIDEIGDELIPPHDRDDELIPPHDRD